MTFARPIRVRLVALACAVAVGAPAGAQVNLPALGDSVSESVDVGAERRLGDQVMREIRRDPDYIDDPLLLEYLQSVWQPLVAAARAGGNIGADLDGRFAWEPFLVRDRSVNAFALPGGYIGCHLGLIAMTVNRDELASVLAHELSHITQRHIARGMVNQQRASLLGMAAMIAGVIAAGRSNRADAGNALIVGGQAAAMQGVLNFSRDMEREADRVGMSVLDRAGFAPAGMASMFEKLDYASRLNDSNGYPYLRSHPLTTERIGDARARVPAGISGASLVAASSGSRFEHELMRARARALMDPRVESLRRLQEQDGASAPAGAGDAEKIGLLAASAQASLVLHEPARAAVALQRARAMLPPGEARADRALRLLQAEQLIGSNDLAAAAQVLKPLDADVSRPLVLERAQLASVGRDAVAWRRSADELQTRVALSSHDAGAWGALAPLWARLNQPLRELRAQAEAHAALGDLNGAIDRLRAAQRMAKGGGVGADYIEASVIDARARELEAQRRALIAEARGGRGGD